jgi:hypothetical protein
LKGYGNDHPFPPEIQVDSPYLHQRISRLQEREARCYSEADAKLKNDAAERARFDAWRKSSRRFLADNPSGWLTPLPMVSLRFKDTNSVPDTNFVVAADRWVQLGDLSRENTKITLSLSNIWVNAIRLEILAKPAEGNKSEEAEGFKKATVSLRARLKSDDDHDNALSFNCAEADHKTVHYLGGHPVIGVKDGWDISTSNRQQVAVWILDKPVQVKSDETLTIDLGPIPVSALRISVTPFAADEPLDAGVGRPLNKALGRILGASHSEKDLIDRTYLLSTQCDSNCIVQLRGLQDQVRECRHGRALTMVTEACKPLVMRVLRRGNWQDEGGDLVQPLVPHFLPQIPNPDNRRLTRLDLARWLVSPENPLTSRAVMNRLWKQFFGTGISAIVDDLGAQGEWPVHPELLDWLAFEFMNPTESLPREAGGDAAFSWDVKHMVRLIVMSSTYRQDSNERPELKEVDPNNRLVACQSPRRLEAEFVRDNALEIAGMLSPDLGGPSVFPYQPAGYYIYLQFPDRDYYANKDERQYRRGIYTHWQRAFLHPMLANFDAPSREECTANRIVSDTPQQALTLLNDPTFVEASRVFATHVLGTGQGGDNEKLDAAFRRALARLPNKAERESLLAFLGVQREQYGKAPEDAQKLIRIGNAPVAPEPNKVELAAWTQVCRVILNLHETITRF